MLDLQSRAPALQDNSVRQKRLRTNQPSLGPQPSYPRRGGVQFLQLGMLN